MEEVIKEYLNVIFPNAYRRDTIFGNIAIHDGRELYIENVISEVMLFFGKLFYKEYCNIVWDWFNSIPMVKPIPNSTNHDVLIYDF